MIGVPESGGGLERWIKIAVMSSICHDYVVCSNSWQFRPCILSLLSAHSISMRFAQIATRARLYRHVGHRSQEFNLFRLQLFFATTVAWSSCVTCVERLQCWQRSAPRPSALQSLLPPLPGLAVQILALLRGGTAHSGSIRHKPKAVRWSGTPSRGGRAR